MQFSRINSRAALLTLVGLLTVLLLSACEEKAAEKKTVIRPVIAIRVADTSGLSERAFPGRARAGQEVNLSFRVSGPLIALPANVGDEFKSGDVVARIDPRDFETAARTVRGQLEREQARAKRAEADLRRLKNVMKEDPGATSQAAIDRARQIRDSSAASARSLAASLAAAKDRLSYTQLKAPFDGRVAQTYVENFETVVAKQPILRLLNPASIEFVISVPENLIGLAPSVESVEVKFDALPGVKVPAKIKEIGKEASQATRTYPVTLVMTQPEGVEILPGMAGAATITSRPPDSSGLVGIQIPATALFTGADSTKFFVWIIDEASKTLSRREVEAGRLSNFGVLIKSGLKAGEWVVIKGVHSVGEGQQIRIIDAAKEKGAS
ncbi:MAG: efflux RND transporter periplasmic adaptor subunit [Planctomycetota bacterium]|nr:efflux RND transporter periplasmic adaptor subunit [Planctomycetota bacterium]